MKIKVTYFFQPAQELPVRLGTVLKPAAQRKKIPDVMGRGQRHAALLPEICTASRVFKPKTREIYEPVV